MAAEGIKDLGTEVLTTESSAAGGLRNPIRGFRFTVNFQGLGTSSFRTIQGFSSEVGVTEYREGGFGRLTVRKLPGLLTYGDITLEKGLYQNPLLYNYFNSFLEGETFAPVNATITVFDNAGEATASWQVINAWPSRYESGGLDATSGEVLVETLTMQHEGITRDTTPVTAT